ncbi:MAG: GNAT family N-acetyltransferase [Gemmatimonadetes bacterium]|nr:GNAT family N-acetyltransferase [Gemmatimonadota bacterium]MBP6668103.1 GNAT family N-acetyltransferase [Gemmatimonadales bacterium]MBK6779270.1 GNAT family N-acetyltransferase [Gemmatimonadota bacterium]MBK7348417.1 GNAT family N-acetyltransferase [Gemmatimonadota bacterium]MBK7713987.1 GNAT family N-acetyltransferase [Gemmatimonadota bacterium]
MEIRRATLADLDALAGLFDGYRQFYRQPADPELSRAFLEERLRLADTVLFLAADGESVLGFVHLFPVFTSTGPRPGRLWLLNDLFVQAAGRRRGVARALMERATAHARETGARGLFLQTGRNNLAARALYESLGYVRDDVFLVYELGLDG